MTEPVIRVVRGVPADEELAALTVLLPLLLTATAPEPSRAAVTWPAVHGRYRSPVSWRHAPRAA